MSLYHDTDAEGHDGILIAEGLPESDSTGSYVWNTQNVPAGSYYIYATIDDGNNGLRTDYSDMSVTLKAEVVGRHVFYEHSNWDDPSIDGRDDDDAIATDKKALRPGETAVFAN